MRINKNSLIPYISIFISVLFYYAEMAHQLFFNIFSHATNAIALFGHINIISHYYLVYLIVITPVFVFLNGKMNSLYKCLFYFIFPYFLSLFAWTCGRCGDIRNNAQLGGCPHPSIHQSTEYFYSGNIRNSGSNRSYC